jgi:hypothetical protein
MTYISPPYTKAIPHDRLHNKREHIDRTTQRCSQNSFSAFLFNTCRITSAALHFDAWRIAPASMSNEWITILQRVSLSLLVWFLARSKKTLTAPAEIIWSRTCWQWHKILACNNMWLTKVRNDNIDGFRGLTRQTNGHVRHRMARGA